MSTDKKRFTPKTPPTGPPADRSRVVPRDEVQAPQVHTLLAWRVRACYAQERSRWESLKAGHTVTVPVAAADGKPALTIDGEHEVQPAAPPVWQRVVAWCQARSVNPEEYVRVAFSGLDMRDVAPPPAQLLGDKFWTKWQAVIATMERDFKVALATQKDTALRYIVVRQKVYNEPAEIAHMVVTTNSHLDLSPLFRYCLAVSIGTRPLRKVARKLLARAVLQYECYPRLYRKTWADVLPSGFAAKSRLVYPVVLAKLGLGPPPGGG